MTALTDTLRLLWFNLRLRLAELTAPDELLFDALRRVYWTPRKEKE